MVEPLVRKGVFKRLNHMGLPNQLRKALRPPFDCKNGIAHVRKAPLSLSCLDPRQPYPGTRPDRYRCSLPGLTEFTDGRRGGTGADRGYFSRNGLTELAPIHKAVLVRTAQRGRSHRNFTAEFRCAGVRRP